MADAPSNIELFGIAHGEGWCNGPIADINMMSGGSGTSAAVWPVANRDIAIPIILETPQTLQAITFVVATASGNYDVGIYDEQGNARYRKGSTAVPAAGLAVVTTTPTALEPGCYWLAMAINNITASVNRSAGVGGNGAGGGLQRVIGVYAHSSDVFPLPDPFVFTSIGSTSYFPVINAHFTGV